MKTNLYQLALEAAADDHEPVIVVIDDIDDLVSGQSQVEEPAEGIGMAVLAAKELSAVADMLDANTNGDTEPTENEIKLLEVVLEGIYQRLGIDMPKELSMEALSETTWGERGTRIKDGIVKILEAILEALRRAGVALAAYMRKLFDTAARLEKYAYGELQSVRKLRGSPRQLNYDNARLAKALWHGAEPLEQVYEELFTLVEDAGKSADSGFVPAIIRMIDDFVANKDTSSLVNGFPAVFERTFGGIFKHDNENSVLGFLNVADGVNIHSTAMLPGGYYAAIAVPDTVTHLKEFAFVIKRPIDEVSVAAELKVLTLDQMKWALDSIIKVTSKIRQFDAIERRTGSMVDRLQDAINRMKKIDKDLLINPNRDVLRALATVAPSLARGIHQQTFTFALQSFRSLIEHVKRSADFYADAHAVATTTHEQNVQPGDPLAKPSIKAV